MTDDPNRVQAAFARGRDDWPGLPDMTPEKFRSFVEEAAIEDAALEKHAADVFLAAAAVAGGDEAARIFETRYLAELPRWLARFHLSSDTIEEVRQRVCTRLLVGPPPRLRQYRAEGPLGAWLRVAAVRTALDMCAADMIERETLGDAGAGLVQAIDPERLMIRHQYRALFESTLREAVAALSARDRNLLRFHYVADMSHEAIGRVYHVHRSTVVRWLASIREELETAVQIRIWDESGVSPSEFRSLWIAVRSDVDISLCRLLSPE